MARHFGADPPLLHFSLGFSVFVLTLMRLAVRASADVPAAHVAGQRWLASLAAIMHASLYVLLIAIPLSGWYVASRMNLAVSILGWIVPPISAPAADSAPGPMGVLHQIGGNILLTLAILHGATAFWHQFALKNGVLKRMNPFSH